MESLLLKQEDTYEQLVKAHTNYKKTPRDRIKVSYIEARLENLEKLWDRFTKVHIEIVGKVKKEEKLSCHYFTEEVYSNVEEFYTDYKTKLKDDLEECKILRTSESPQMSTPTVKATTSCEVKLPQILLPKFSGGYEQWQTFYDMFLSLIHKSSNLSAVQKLHYLKSSLSGEPENLLKNLSTTETNYEEAWNQLTRRYNNKRYNCNEIMKRLFSQKNIVNESATAIKELLDTTSACLKSLNNLTIDTSSWDAIINHLVISKLDTESRKQWEVQVSQTESDELPTWNQLVKFLETRFRTLEMLDVKKPYAKPFFNALPNQIPKQKIFHSTVQDENKTSQTACVMCTGQHVIYQCKQFGKQTPEERSEFVQSKRLCFNCLAPTHSVRACHQSTCCRKCGRRHHTLLHLERNFNKESRQNEPTNNETRPTSVQNQSASRDTETRVVAHLATKSNESEMLLATAVVKAKSTNGYSQIIRVLIDPCSEASFITEATVQSLGLKKVPVNGVVSGVGDGQTRTKNMVSLSVESLINPEYSIQIDAYVLSTLTSFLPTSKTKITDWPDIRNLPLADPKYGAPGRIDIILGVEIYSAIILGGLMKHPSKNGPIAQNTQLGWVLSGRVHNEATPQNHRVISFHIQVKEDQLLKSFWEIEREPDSIKNKFSKEEQRSEEIFEATTVRDDDGRYVVRLPFKTSNPDCLYGRSNEIAFRRFLLLEKRLQKNPELREEYKKVIDGYKEQNHIVQITDMKEMNDGAVVYLPHHPVVREDKDTTKVRVVFDASCKGVNNVSLNDNLLVGPKLQQDLRHILMRWRRHPYCIVADLVQMYRQVRVHEPDTDFQRIMWRSDPNLPIEHYKLLRLTFGTACAPYLAVKSLQQLAKDEQLKYPKAATITLEDYYMDDLLTGSDTEQEAIEIYEQMNGLMNDGGFNLQKWCSNSDKLLNHIKEESQSHDQSHTFKESNMVKVLGICWNKDSDNFEYVLNLPEMRANVTKRKVLSDIARLYDPVGWIAPVIVGAKIFIQKLWKSGLGWDDELTPELLREWVKFRDDLTNVKSIVIPRWLHYRTGDQVELHAFADASQAAYAAAVYIKIKDKSHNVHVHLVTAKTKVAPVEKEVSIPRLELCAALLAAKLIFEVAKILGVPNENLYAWSDSSVVLAWLRGEPSRWTTFVSNRVSEIHTMLEKSKWGHVRTNQNPADCASRGISSLELINHELWWHGPEWLSHNDEYKLNQDFTTNEEQRPIKTLTTVIQPKEELIWKRFSTLQRALRVLSYCRKFLNLKLPKEQRVTLSKLVTTQERDEVLEVWIKETQREHFEDEIKQLKSQGNVYKRSKLHTLSPILDEKGILRVGGRITQAQENFDKIHPIIIPSESHLTRLIVSDAHIKTLHGGPQVMLNLLRSKFWIIRARERVKKCYRECIICVRYSKQNNNQFMGQLPASRLRPSRPFKSTGVDFTGYINIRFSPGRGSKSYKGYICVFICMATRAIHLEAVSDLTAKGFIAAYRRFVSRRGHCQDLYSDNGTNFVGADRELREMFNRAVSELPTEIGQLLANEGTTWHFIPPHAPNFGGLWEAAVRSTKKHLKRVVGDSTLTFEELSTVLAQIEACLNSRPISQLSDNPEDPMPLTPGHFLVGEPLIVIPHQDLSQANISGLQRWKLTQKMVTDFWKKWSEEYLVTLNQRYKWLTKKTEPDINDIVIVKDHNLPPAKWLLGKIMEKHLGKDNITRVMTIKTKNGLSKRPCNKLCILPKDSQ